MKGCPIMHAQLGKEASCVVVSAGGRNLEDKFAPYPFLLQAQGPLLEFSRKGINHGK